MSYSFTTSLLDIDRQPGKAPILLVEATGDVPGWAAEHRDGLRALVAEHGSIMVRGLGLRDAAEVTAVFRRLATNGLMVEREAFASRRVYADGVYSSATWPANQPMCMHHELSYRLEVPSLLLFACLSAPTRGGATAVSDSPTVLDALPGELDRPVRAGWLDADPQLQRRDRGDRLLRRSGPRIAAPSKAIAAPMGSGLSGSVMVDCGPGSGVALWCGIR